MTPDELERAVRGGDVGTVVRLLRGASEEERRAAAPQARELRDRYEILRVGGSVEQDEAAKLAVYGTASVSELRKARGPASWPPRHHEADVLSGRPAAIVAPLIAWQLERHWGWHVARALVRDGTIPTPDTEWYVLRFIADRSPPKALIADDPALLDHEVWRLFEVEGSGEFCLAARDKYVAEAESWQAALVELADADPLRRARLLDASLDALARDFSTFRAGWFSRFHEALEPTVEERSERLDRYVTLLRSQVKPTLTMAVAAVADIEQAGHLDPDRVLGRLGQALAGAAASTAIAALKLLRRVGEAGGPIAARAARDAVEALANSSAEVQHAALTALNDLVTGPEPLLASRMRVLADGVAASRRSALADLLARLHADGPSDTPPVREPAHAGTAGAAVRRPTDRSRALAPVVDVGELILLLGRLLEVADAPDDLERALDGVARLSRALDDERMAAPLHKRASTVLRRRLAERQSTDLRHDIAALVLTWLGGEVVPPPRLHLDAHRHSRDWFSPIRRGSGTEPPVGADRFLARRLLSVATAAAERRPVSLLGIPTHAGGWIAPGVLVDRLSTADPDAIDRLDLVQALLRLAPDGREEALDRAATIPGEAGAALRHALGGTEKVGPTPALWAAAARARAPDEDDDRVIARHAGLGPNGGRVARIGFVAGEWNEVPGGLDLVLEPHMPGELDDDVPATVMLVSPFASGFDASGDPGMCRWVSTIWPAGTEAWAAIGAIVMGRNIDWWGADWTNRIHLEAFLLPWAEMGPLALTLLGVALGAKERGERGLAADVAIAAIGDGRLDGDALAGALRATLPMRCARPRRWADSLGDVASTSRRHADVVLEATGGALEAVSSLPAADLVPLLRLMNELVQEGRGVGSQAVASLREIPGRGTARRLADEILAAT